MSESVTPRELAVFVAGMIGVPAKSAIAVDRVLCEAGLRPSYGRGLSARPATARDAATLIVALAGSRTFEAAVTHAAETVHNFGELASDDSVLAMAPLQESGIPALAALDHEHVFLDALTAAIRAASRSEFLPRTDVFVTLFSPWPAADIQVTTPAGSWAAGYRRPWPEGDHVTFKRFLESEAREFGTADFHERRTLGTRTIERIGQLLAREAG